MRVSTGLINLFSLDAMLQKQGELSITQLQVSTGNRLLSPAMDPYGSSRALNLDESVKVNVQYTVNANYAETRLTTAEGALDAVGEAIQRTRELAVYGSNDSQTSESRKSISEEIKKILEQLIDLGNTQDANKEFLFSGYQGKTQPFARGVGGGFVYNGDDGQRTLKIGTATHVAISDSGDDVFMSTMNGNGVFQANAATTNKGTGVIDPGAIVDNFVKDEYTIKFIQLPSDTPTQTQQYYVVNKAGMVVTYIDRANPAPLDNTLRYWDPTTDPVTGSYLPALPLPSPANVIDEATFLANVAAGTAEGVPYQEFAQIAGLDHYGIQTTILGTPAALEFSSAASPPAPPYAAIAGTASDSFTIKPSENQSLFQTVQNLIDAFDGPQKKPEDKALMHNKVNNVIANLDQNLGKIIDVRARIGARMNITASQKQTNESFNLQMNIVLSEIRDLDYAEAITRLNRQLLGLDSAQKAYQKITSLSLFNYL